ncbi:GDSL-type esterase/lipase family protein [Paludicola sp. MB14-C6]|uniref:SGNH/GDSL hydrolase family protein n=1 Tax=Paludihabitans sp. MB14-C6 TaxID=3070656 RepID=UPI0027DD461E|nr:GDSL-type esterase/lipase family protein [Paludicola sp. MB14-C6]WMJ22484.1 GDSL-type esterase/lipase family protein [Paludicola sp. MB14-C6]
MSKTVKIMMYVTIIVVSLSASLILLMCMPTCKYCGNKFCFGGCTIVYEDNREKSPNLTYGKKTNQPSTRLSSTKRANDSYLDKLTFIGDSRTVALKTHANIPQNQIFAENGLNHEQAMTDKVVKLQDYKSVTIPKAVETVAPSIMIVNFGVNGVGWMSEDTFMQSYETFINEIMKRSPNSIVVIESIMPVSVNYDGTNKVTNDKIDRVNDRLYELAKKKGLYYMATNEALKNEYNALDSRFDSGDGLHYNKTAYEVIVDYFLTHAIIKK